MPCTNIIVTMEYVQMSLFGGIKWPHAVPRLIISNRDMNFTSDLLTEVRKRLLTKLHMLQVIYTQTDWLWEISNQCVTWYLQAFTTHHQDKWDTIFPITQYANNTFTHLSTNWNTSQLYFEITSYNLLDFIMAQWQLAEMQSLHGTPFIEPLQAILLDAQESHYDAQDSQMVKANRSWRPCNVFGDFLRSRTKDLQRAYVNQDHSLRKLPPAWAAPYMIITFHGSKAVIIELLDDMFIHNPAYGSRLIQYTVDYRRETPPPPTVWNEIDWDGTIQCSYVADVIAFCMLGLGVTGGYK